MDYQLIANSFKAIRDEILNELEDTRVRRRLLYARRAGLEMSDDQHAIAGVSHAIDQAAWDIERLQGALKELDEAESTVDCML